MMWSAIIYTLNIHIYWADGMFSLERCSMFPCYVVKRYICTFDNFKQLLSIYD